MNARLAIEQLLRDEEKRADEVRAELTAATVEGTLPAVRVRPMLPARGFGAINKNRR